MFLGRNSIVPSSQSALKFAPIYQNNWANATPLSQGFSVSSPFSRFFGDSMYYWRDFTGYRKHLENFGQRYLAMKN